MAGGKRWSQEEDDFLLSLCGDLPWPMVMQQMRRLAVVNGWPQRTDMALESRTEDLKISRLCFGQWIGTNEAARCLKTDTRIIARLAESGRLKTKTVGGVRWISRAALRDLARREPQRFAGLSEGELLQLLDSESLAEELAAMKMKRRPRRRPVVCVETGWHYPSVMAAARAAYVDSMTMRSAIKNGWRANGRHWRHAT